MEAFTYCWSDHATGKIYVGAHKGSVDDGYVCSSKYMMPEYKKRQQDFTRQILFRGSWKECRTFESAILNSLLKTDSNTYYNRHSGGMIIHAPDVCKKISEANKGKLVGSKNPMYGRVGALNPNYGNRGKKNPLTGKPLSEEIRKKISEANKGRIISEESREKVRQALTGRKASEETKAKQSAARKGRKLSEETKTRMSLAMKGKKKSPEAVEKVRQALKGRPATEKQLASLALGRVRAEGYVSPLKGLSKPTPWMVGRIPKNKGVPASAETRAKLSQIAKGRVHSPEHVDKRMASRRATRLAKGQIKSVVVNGVIYECINTASLALNIPIATLGVWCRGKGKPGPKYDYIVECRWA